LAAFFSSPSSYGLPAAWGISDISLVGPPFNDIPAFPSEFGAQGELCPHGAD
jgi:hypothetical protein